MERAEKSEMVASLNRVFKDHGTVIVAQYTGLTVADMTSLRGRMRAAGGGVKVAKNRLVKLALQGTDAVQIADLFKGPTVIAYSKDPVAAAKVSVDFAKTNEKLVILGGAIGRTNLNPDGVKALAFAKVDQNDFAQVEAALAIFGGIWLGITVLDANQQEFANGQAWTDVPGSPIDGGHAILGGGYTPDVKFITWAQEIEFAPSFWSGSVNAVSLVEEAWVVIWPEHLGSKSFLSGIDLQQLAADYLDLTGETLTLPG